MTFAVFYFFIQCYFVIAFTLLQGNLGTPLSTSPANSLYEPQPHLSADEYIEIIDMQSSQWDVNSDVCLYPSLDSNSVGIQDKHKPARPNILYAVESLLGG